jgi:hypothetical protein
LLLEMGDELLVQVFEAQERAHALTEWLLVTHGRIGWVA